jgi:putative ABC transport system substrate-binding protein
MLKHRARMSATLVLLCVAGLAHPIAAVAQPGTRPVTIGVLCTGFCPFPVPPEPSRALITALERIGLVQGRTLRWDIGAILNSEDQVAVEARNLVSRRPDLMLVWPGSVAAARAAKEATRTIPIVLMAVSDVTEHGLVNTLKQPGGNITGTSVPLFDLTMKQLQVLKEMQPKLKRVIVAQGQIDPAERRTIDRLRGAATSLGLDPGGISVSEVDAVEQALAGVEKGAAGLVAFGSIPHVVQRRLRVLALERRLPLIFPWRVYQGGGHSGTVIVYGPHFPTIAERTASLIERILKGARPADLPVEEPTRYGLVIDGVMTKALGLDIPPAVRARADEILE